MPPATALRGEGVESPLQTYLGEIKESPLLTAEEEKQLASEIANGGIEARDRMIRANLRLVVNLARSYTGRGLDLEDLIAEGNLGLLHAVERFDPSMNTRFSTYASFWIKQAIQRALVNTAKTIRVPAYMVVLLAKWRRASAKLHNQLGRPPAPEEVAEMLGLPKKKLRIIQKIIPIYSAPAQTDEPDAARSIEELLIDARAKAENKEMMELQYVFDLLNKLDPREASVLKMRYGLENDEPKTLKEIGESLGLTRERVRQIETEALNKLSAHAIL